jgi:hypothetical protein
MKDFGTIVIDDFHRLAANDQDSIAQLMKLVADKQDASRKIIVLGINQAGSNLIRFARDAALRISRIRFESEPDNKVEQVIAQGEQALNISIESRESVVEAAQGSFYLAQLLCSQICVLSDILEKQDKIKTLNVPFTSAKREVMAQEREKFGDILESFAKGPRFRPGGRANYFHILRWLAESPEATINPLDEANRHPNEKYSVKQVVDKGHLARHCENTDIASIFYYNQETKTLAIEDPHLIFYLHNMDWGAFIKKVGFTKVETPTPYDIALSFAGEDRAFAEELYTQLEERGVAVFYDKAEQARILADSVPEVLGAIYESGSEYVVAILGKQYGVKRWTLFEKSKYETRIEDRQVIPVWSIQIPPNAFDPLQDHGGATWDPDGDIRAQAAELAQVLVEKLGA